MSSYIASNDNRLYAAVEEFFGNVPTITGNNRFPAVRLSAKQSIRTAARRDKTGTRSYLGSPAGSRRETEFAVKTYLTAWGEQTEQPGYGPLFQAAMGAEPLIHAGGPIASAPSLRRLVFGTTHSLTAGQAVAIGGEIRFVSAVVDALTVEVNAPFSTTPGMGSQATPTITYRLGKTLPSASIFDYWSPEGAVQRILYGAAVDKMTAKINADFHEFEFSGPARDVIDNNSFEEGQGELNEFPEEPDSSGFSYSVVPGHIGQAWLGVSPERFYTLISADLKLTNALETRTKEFGLDGMRAVAPGQRSVTVNFEVFASDEDSTTALYTAARQRSPLSVMFQLGDQEQQLFGVYMKSVIADIPEYDDTDPRLAWSFENCRAQGTDDDELVIAFA